MNFFYSRHLQRLALLCLCLLHVTPLQAITPEEDKALFQQRVTTLRQVFGPIDFSDKKLFNAMLYVGVRPLDEMMPLKGENEQVVKVSTEKLLTLAKIRFFKQPLQSQSLQTPTHYYKGGTIARGPDLLYNAWNDQGRSFSLYETMNAIILTSDITPKFRNTQTFEREQVAQFLFDSLALENFSVQDISEKFRIPAVLSIGDVLTNNPRGVVEAPLAGGWQTHVICFVGKDGLSILCFKAWPGGAVSRFPLLYDWLGLEGKATEEAVALPQKLAPLP